MPIVLLTLFSLSPLRCLILLPSFRDATVTLELGFSSPASVHLHPPQSSQALSTSCRVLPPTAYLGRGDGRLPTYCPLSSPGIIPQTPTPPTGCRTPPSGRPDIKGNPPKVGSSRANLGT
ncbi:hypothetical protein EV126DRAFT_421427 [Verticillium dahliae]|nr:hypothetical protein EV126DRAFT_421427 [Verticillium dahliae]